MWKTHSANFLIYLKSNNLVLTNQLKERANMAIRNLYLESGQGIKGFETGVMLFIGTQEKGKKDLLRISLSQEAKAKLTAGYIEISFDEDKSTMLLKNTSKGKGYKIQKTAPHLRLSLPEYIPSNIGDGANVEIDILPNGISFKWPFSKKGIQQESQEPLELKTDKEKILRTIDESDVPITAKTISEKTRISKSECIRLLNNLVLTNQLKTNGKIPSLYSRVS